MYRCANFSTIIPCFFLVACNPAYSQCLKTGSYGKLHQVYAYEKDEKNGQKISSRNDMTGIEGTDQNMPSHFHGKTPSGLAMLLSSTAADSAHKVPASRTSATIKEKNLSGYMGTYMVIAVKKYGGGLTSKAQAMQHIGTPMIELSTTRVTVTDNRSIKNPDYAIINQPKPVAGVVVSPNSRYSNFYGFGMDRKVVSVLQVHDPADKDPTPYYEFELLRSGGKNEIWYMDDGWLYELEQAQ